MVTEALKSSLDRIMEILLKSSFTPKHIYSRIDYKTALEQHKTWVEPKPKTGFSFKKLSFVYFL